jgi:hypothetical protein
MTKQEERNEHEHRWVGRGECGDTTNGYMCADCGADLDDLPEEEEVTA